MASKIKPFPKGISRQIITRLSAYKNEPDWMLEHRLKSFEVFSAKPLPTWGPDLSELDFQNITYFAAPNHTPKSLDDLPSDLKTKYAELGIPEAEQRYLGGLVTQYESEALLTSLKDEWHRQGVIFCSLDEALQKYPDLVRQYFMTKCVPIADNKFSALHGAVWSGGTFIYVPKGLKVQMPLQTYFFMHSREFGQFEHTLIIAEQDSSVSYYEACSAPRYNTSSLHSAVVEIFVHKNAAVSYTTVQNWSKDVYNLNTKRAIVYENGQMEWTGGSFGAYISMLYPSSVLMESGACSKYRAIAIANHGQTKDGGSKATHLAPNTTSEILSKSISLNGGRANFRGLIKIIKGATNSRAKMRCESMILDDRSAADAFPDVKVHEPDVRVTHEATVGKIEEEQLFYLATRGISEREAESLLVHGFFEPVIAKMPMEYALELDRLIDLELERDTKSLTKSSHAGGNTAKVMPALTKAKVL